MGLIAGIAAGIAALAVAAAKFYAHLKRSGVESEVSEGIERSTTVVIGIATAIRGIWEAMSIVSDLLPVARRTASAIPIRRRHRAWSRTVDDLEAAGVVL